MTDETNIPREVKTPSGRHTLSIDQWVSMVQQKMAGRDELYDRQARYEKLASSGNLFQKAWYGARLAFLKKSPEYKQ